jgi:hypothetical protein
LPLHEVELGAGSKPNRRAEPRGHRDQSIINSTRKLRRTRNSQALAALGAAAPEDVTTILRMHSDEKAVGLSTPPTIRLKRALHGAPSRVSATRRNLNRSEPGKRVSTYGPKRAFSVVCSDDVW